MTSVMHSFRILSQGNSTRSLETRSITARSCLTKVSTGLAGMLTSLLAPWCWAVSTLCSTVRAGITKGLVALMVAVRTPNLAATPALDQSQSGLANCIARRRYYIVVLDSKGGVGKSLMLQIAYEVVVGDDRIVLVMDTDADNKNMKRSGMITVDDDVVESDRVDFEGYLFDASDRLRRGEVDAVVIDSGATAEKYFYTHLPDISRELCENGCRLIVIRPLTTNPINQDNLVDFGRKGMTKDMGVLMVKNFGQGRTQQDYAIWDDSAERREMMERGMTEIKLENAGALAADIAMELGISVAKLALMEPSEHNDTEKRRQISTLYLKDQYRLFIARWLGRQVTAFEKGFATCLQRTGE